MAGRAPAPRRVPGADGAVGPGECVPTGARRRGGGPGSVALSPGRCQCAGPGPRLLGREQRHGDHRVRTRPAPRRGAPRKALGAQPAAPSGDAGDRRRLPPPRCRRYLLEPLPAGGARGCPPLRRDRGHGTRAGAAAGSRRLSPVVRGAGRGRVRLRSGVGGRAPPDRRGEPGARRGGSAGGDGSRALDRPAGASGIDEAQRGVAADETAPRARCVRTPRARSRPSSGMGWFERRRHWPAATGRARLQRTVWGAAQGVSQEGDER